MKKYYLYRNDEMILSTKELNEIRNTIYGRIMATIPGDNLRYKKNLNKDLSTLINELETIAAPDKIGFLYFTVEVKAIPEGIQAITRKPAGPEVLAAAVETFGDNIQIIKAVEELAELQQVLIKYLLEGDEHTDHVLEEMADVKIMYEQLEIIFNNPAGLESWRNIKLDRLAETIRVFKGVKTCD